MLNIEFAQHGWRPDPTAIYQASSVTTSKCHGFTYLMALVMSGRDPLTGRLTREAELQMFLASPESAAECRRVTSDGRTALMLSARNSSTDSTEATVAMLLAHESGVDVARLQTEKGWTALMMAARYSNTDSTDQTVAMLLAHESSAEVARMQNDQGWTALMMAARYSISTDQTVAMMLAHESSAEVARMQNDHGWTALMMAARYSNTDSTDQTVAMLLAHESSVDVMRMQTEDGCSIFDITTDPTARSTDHTVDLLCQYADDDQLAELSQSQPHILLRYTITLRQRVKDRETLKQALQQGLSLPGATMLLYL